MPGLSQAKHLISLVLVVILGALAPVGGTHAESLEVRSAELLLNPDQPEQGQVGGLTYLGGLILAADGGDFGGYSGIAVDADGGGLWAIADTGHWLRLDFRRTAAGLPDAIAAARILPLRDANGMPVTRKVLSDAEGLRHLADGRWLISFERAHRLWFYDEPGGKAAGALEVPASVAQQPDNGGIEAVASFASGELLLFSEEKPALVGGNKQDTAAWLLRGGQWHDLAWPARDDFKPTDAVALPGGDVLLLQRYFTPLVGPKARISRIAAADIQPGAVLKHTLLAEWARPVSVDNMEALDIRRADDGSTWLYVMSDDNQNRLQRTLLMVFRLEPQ